MNPTRLIGRVERRICLGLSEALRPHCTCFGRGTSSNETAGVKSHPTRNPWSRSSLTNDEAEYLPSHFVSKAKMCVYIYIFSERERKR